jgi:hypothetical protein
MDINLGVIFNFKLINLLGASDQFEVSYDLVILRTLELERALDLHHEKNP